MEIQGTNNPMIYFLYEEYTDNKESFSYLTSIIYGLGLNENNCRFVDYSENELDENILEDIKTVNPKVIMLLGASAIKLLVPDMTGGVIKNRGNMKEFMDKYVVIPTYHPNYLIKNQDPARRMEFKSDIKLAIKVAMDMENLNLYDAISNNTKKLEENKSITEIITNSKEFNEFYDKYLKDSKDVSFDVETNAKVVNSVEHKVVGFSLASSKDIGCYVPLKSLDYEVPQEDKKLIEDKMREIMKTKNVIVYNCQHELPVTLNWLDVEINSIDDIFVMVKLMMGNADRYQGNGGLKAQSVEHLNSKDWSEDLDIYFYLMKHYTEEGNKEKMRELISKYYESNEIDDIIKKIEDVIFDELPGRIPDAYVISYEYVPYKLIGRYGSIDSAILFELKDFYDKWMDDEGKKLGIDLHQGYRYWMQHHLAGYVLERNGVYWNDKKAQEVENWCLDGMNNSLKELIISPLSESYLKDKLEFRFLQMLKENFLEEILAGDFIPKRLYKTSVHVEVKTDNGHRRLLGTGAVPNSKGIVKLELSDLKVLAGRFLNDKPFMFTNWYKMFMRSYKEEKHTTEEYKELLNPTATAPEFKDFISSILVTSQIRNAKSFTNLVELTEDPSFVLENFSGADRQILDIVIEARNMSDSRVDPAKLDFYLEKMSNIDLRQKFSGKIYTAISRANSYKMTKLDAEVLNEIYDLYIMCHMDVEDPSTWTEQFKWLFHYKLYKKFAKILSTYINGKVGRNNVWYVDKESLQRGDLLTRREKLYDKNYECPENKTTLLNADFRINMAETGRWQAGIHNVPAGEVIKGIFTSRFPGGTIACPDGSQMEVRTMAAQSGDENLLKAFKDGLDIHRFFASKIYKVDYDKVEKWQRGLAKNAVFGILYGESIKAFADSYLKGDMVEAQKIFDDMFEGFPRIKEYIDRAQNQYKKFQKVTTLTQRYIDLTNRPAMTRDGNIDMNAMLRKAQNYPIQAGAEDIAGIIMYKLSQFIKDNNFKTKIFCFIHDSIEMDIHPMELFPMVDKINYMFNVFPVEEFNVPVATDIPLGPSMGQECEIKEFEHSDDFNDNTITLDGYIDDIEELLDIWRSTYKLVEVYDDFKDEDEEEYIPYSKAFLPKKAQLSRFAGKYRMKGKRKIHVIVK